MNKKIFILSIVFAAVLFALGYRAALERKEPAEEKNIVLEQTERQEADGKIITYWPSACLEDGAENETDSAQPVFRGNFFDIKYPVGFGALEKERADYGFFQSPDKKAIFAVYSPQWTGDPERLLVQPGEETISDKEEKIEVDCETELGSGGTQRARRIEIRDKDGRYERSVIDIRLIGPDGSGETRKTFSFQYDSAESFEKNKADFEKFMRSLLQMAD